MKQKKKNKLEKPLTEVELELMNVIWDLGDCTVKGVQTVLAKDRELAYTSVATIMKILEQKGILKSIKTERSHLYSSLISRSEYEAASLEHIAKNLFHNDPSAMVMRLINDSKLSSEELKEIRKVLEERLES